MVFVICTQWNWHIRWLQRLFSTNHNSHYILHLSHTPNFQREACTNHELIRKQKNQPIRNLWIYLTIPTNSFSHNNGKQIEKKIKILSLWKAVTENFYLNMMWQHIEQMPAYKCKMDIWKAKTNYCMYSKTCCFPLKEHGIVVWYSWFWFSSVWQSLDQSGIYQGIVIKEGEKGKCKAQICSGRLAYWLLQKGKLQQFNWRNTGHHLKWQCPFSWEESTTR